MRGRTKRPNRRTSGNCSGWHWWNTLDSLSAEDTIVFDTETTGVDPELDEAVSIAVQSYAAPKGVPVEYHTLIKPRIPEKLLYQNAEMKSAYDIHGIHPDDLLGQPSFPGRSQHTMEDHAGEKTGYAGTPTLMSLCSTASASDTACP